MRDVIAAHAPIALAGGGLLIGIVFGWIVARTNFCTMGALSDIHAFGDYRRFRAWVLAAATALIAAQVLQRAGVVDLEKSMYLAPRLDWFGNVAGGAMFGYGMVFAGGCASRNLVRAGGGDLRSLVVLIVIGICSYIALGGFLGPARAALSAWTSIDLTRFGMASASLGELFPSAGGNSGVRSAATIGVATVVAQVALLYCFMDAKFRASRMHILSGIGVGLAVAAGWALTGAAYDELAPRVAAPVSLTFVRPTGDTLDWLQRATATPIPGFGVTATIGTLIGAFLAAWSAGRFRLATFANLPDTLRNLYGAALMGVGGVLALGCTIGQAVTGVSTLAIGSFLTFAAIVAGGIAGLKRLESSLTAEV